MIITCHCVKVGDESSGEGRLDSEQVKDDGIAEPVLVFYGGDKVDDNADYYDDIDVVGDDGEHDDDDDKDDEDVIDNYNDDVNYDDNGWEPSEF